MPLQEQFFMRFMRLAGPFWFAENKIIVRRQSALLIALTIAQMVLAVMLTEWNAALFDALEQRSMSGLLTQIGVLILIFAASMIVTASHLVVKRKLQIGWRNWLTKRVTKRWLDKGRHYQVTHLPTAEHDNPDGRIAEDILIATENAIALCHSLFYSLLLIFSFTKILWTLSGHITVNLGLFTLAIEGHLVWVALLYAASASWLGWLIGRPLTSATNAKQSAEANYRFGLVQVRENSQAIALIHGEDNDRQRLAGLFSTISETFDQQTRAWKNILLFTSGYSVLSMTLPIILSAPRFILGTLSLGALIQSAQVFQQLTSALSWPVDNMGAVAQWRASVERILSLMQALDNIEAEIARYPAKHLIVEKGETSVLRLENVSLSKLTGERIIAPLNAEIALGERVLLNSDAANGAKLFKAIAGLWPWGQGRIVLPDGDPMFFMPPLPYLPDGSLRAAICYPRAASDFKTAQLLALLAQAGVADLSEHLDQQDAWQKNLSREQQQRLGLVRLLLNRPKWILLQEAFDALDSDGEANMLEMIFTQLPQASVLTVTNHCTPQGPCAAVHQRHITLVAL